MEVPITEVKRRSHWLKVVGLILGIIVLIAAQTLTSAVHWLQLNPFSWQPLADTSCALIPICNPHYPGYFGLVLVILLVAVVLLVLVLRRSALRVTQDVDWPIAPTERKPLLRRWLALSIFLGELAVMLTWWMVVSA